MKGLGIGRVGEGDQRGNHRVKIEIDLPKRLREE